LTKDGTGLGTHTFQWDAEGRMVSVDGVPGQACQPTWTDCFTYNALGQRVQKHVVSPASDTYYYYNASGNLAMTKSASQVKEYLFPGNFGKYYWTGSAWETDYTHKNLVGSTQVVTRADGSYAQAQNFYPFGGVRWHTGGTQDVRFASLQERDLETETWQDTLDPTWFRTYTSGLGRWFSPDPLAGDITNPQSLNRYAYVLNNPTTLNDPIGLYVYAPPGTGNCGDPFDGGSCTPGPCDLVVDPGCAGQAGGGGGGGGGWGGIGWGWGGSGWGWGGSSGPLSGDYGANLPPLGPRGPGIPCDFGFCGGPTPASGFVSAAAVAAAVATVVCVIDEPCGVGELGLALLFVYANSRVRPKPNWPQGKYPGNDPTKPPWPNAQWRGTGPVGSREGGWFNPDTYESMHPDLQHAAPKGAHWDYIDQWGTEYDIYPNGSMVPKH